MKKMEGLIRFVLIVKYHAYLRKITRFNPTRGGKIQARTGHEKKKRKRQNEERERRVKSAKTLVLQVPSTSVLPRASFTRQSEA